MENNTRLVHPVLFKTPYNRPVRLSDPFYDYEGDASYILETQDENMRWEEYHEILGENLPAGTYEESVYFLPWGLRFMQENPRDAYDCVEDIVGWVHANLDSLRKDGLEVPAREGLRACFETWTGRFEVIHYEPEIWRRMQWSPVDRDIVPYDETICQFIEKLTHCEHFMDIADACMDRLALQRERPAHSAWFLAYATSTRFGILTRTPSSEHILQLISEQGLLKEHARRIRDTLFTAAPTYWHTVFETLGLAEQ